MKKIIPVFMLIIVLMSSCQSSKDFLYLQDLSDSTTFDIKMDKYVKIRPEDRLYVSVTSRDEKTAKLFQQQSIGTSMNNVGANSERGGYVVDAQGNIDFPILGKIRVVDMTRAEVAEYIKKQLIEQNLLMDPSVMVELGNAQVFLLGELGKGAIPITKDHLSIIEAVSLAGGMSDDGLRNKIRVIREDNGVLSQYTIDFTSAEDITNSPVYYLRQNDIIYVEPNKRAIFAKNEFKSVTFWISVITVPITLWALIAGLK